MIFSNRKDEKLRLGSVKQTIRFFSVCYENALLIFKASGKSGGWIGLSGQNRDHH
ncbi:MAG TPA: hypothetical protein VL053_05990 [Arachidicoccus sp.]|nr:hypothetical protein [Arachidicoccus sp.]